MTENSDYKWRKQEGMRSGPCFYCGHVTEHKVVYAYHRHEALWERIDRTIPQEYWHRLEAEAERDYRGYGAYYLAECSKCSGLLLYVCDYFGDMDDYFEDNDGTHCVWPADTAMQSSVPDVVREHYIASLRDSEHRSALTSIRRALEAMCEDKGCKGRDLYEKLTNLNVTGVLPQGCIQIAHTLRRLTNMGAHTTKREPMKQDVRLAKELFEILVQQVYILPHRIAVLSAEFEEREPESSKSESRVQ